MSWNISLVGRPSDVKAAVFATENIPQPLKDCVALFADATKETAIQVISYGHFDKNYGGGNVGLFTIQPVTLVASAPESKQPDWPPPAATK